MASIHWTLDGNGDFSNLADWNNGKGPVPGAKDDAILDAAGATSYTVTASTSEAVHSIQTAATATLSITAGTFAASAGTGTGGNAGSIMVGDSTNFDVGGTLNNMGQIGLNSVGDTTELFLTANTTLSGGGHLTLSDSTGNFIFGTTTTTLNNVDNTISGAGQIGNGQLTLINQKAGVINATGTAAMTLNTTGGAAIANGGLLEATGTGGLAFGSVIVNDSTGGVIAAGTGSFVNIQNADIIGGTLQSTGTGVIKLAGSATLDAATAAMSLSGSLSIADAAALTVKGALTNGGTISLNSVGDVTEFLLSANATLTGGGQIRLSDSAANYLFGAAATDVLVNVDNTISGAGDIGNGQMILKNQAAGVINAVGANALVINLGGQALTNAGLLEGTGSGGLTINNALVDNTVGSMKANANSTIAIVNSTVQNAGGGGIVVANGALGTLQGADIVGGALQIQGTGAFQAVGAASLLDGTKNAITFNGPLSIHDSATLGLAGSIVNSGTISLNSIGDVTELTINAKTTLSGSGHVTLGDSSANYLFGTATTNVLTNVDNTISGAGQIGNGQLTLVNQAAGVINAVGANALLINTAGQTVTNAGLIEASGAGGLTIQSAALNNTGGTIQANTGAVVRLQAADVIGGVLTAQGTGAIQVTSSAEFDGTASSVNLSGSIVVSDAASLQLAGAIVNKGTIALKSVGDITILTIGANTTLSGGGQVTLSDTAANYVQGAAPTDILNNVNNTITGAGQIGNGQLTLVNQAAGVINATGASSALTINTSSQALTNLGLIEATGAGGLTVAGTTVSNAGGTIQANNGSLVTLQGADILGGLLAAKGTGGFTTLGSAELDGTTSTVSLAGPLLVQDSNTLTLAGSIANTGTIALHSVGDTTELLLAANTTLSGGGQITLTDSAANYIFAASTAISLSNVDNTIAGAGVFGNGQLILLNQKAGIINASGVNAITIDTATNTVTNAGLVESTGIGGLRINSPISNSGTLLAHTGTLTVVGALTNVSGTTLTGGTYEADAGATLELPQNTSIVTDKATIIVNGAGSTVEAFNTTTSAEVSLDSTLGTIAASGALEVLGGRNWSSKAAFSNAGLLQLGGGKFATKSLSNSGTTTGFGTITAPLTNSGLLSAQAGKTLSLQGGGLTNLAGGTLTGGTYVVGAGATLQLQDNVSVTTLAASIDLAGAGATLQSLNTGTSAQATLESSLTAIGATGQLQILAGRNYTSGNAVTNDGVLQLGGGIFTSASLSDSASAALSGFGAVASSFSDSGSVTATGGALAFSGAGNVIAGALSGGEVDFTGGSDTLNSGTSLGVATLGLSGGAAVALGASLGFTGVLNAASGTSVALGANTLTLSGAGSTLAGSIAGPGALVLSGGGQTFAAGASLTSDSWSVISGDAVSVAANLSFAGAFSEDAASSAAIAAGATLGFSGNAVLNGTVTGAGALSQSGGAETVNAGAAITMSAWSLTGGAALNLNESLSYAGSLTEDQTSSITIAAGDTLTLTGQSSLAGAIGSTGALALAAGSKTTISGAATIGGSFTEAAATLTVATSDSLTLKGASSFATGAVINGAGTVTVTNATIAGLTVGGTATFSDAGVIDQTGAITLGDTTSNAAKFSIAHGATLKLDGDVGIARGKSALSSLTVTGTLIKTAGTGVSVVAVKVADGGSIEAASGTLEFTQALAGKGGMKIDAGATLEVANTAASTLTATFNGAGATLALTKVAKFAATIAGFTTGQTIDLVKTAATGATVNGSNQLVIVNGAKTVAMLQLSGSYTGRVFNVVSDGHGGASITLAAAQALGPARFAQAMSGIGASGAGLAGSSNPKANSGLGESGALLAPPAWHSA